MSMGMGMPTITHELALELSRWAQNVSWSSLCLFHLQCLASYHFGNEAKQWTRLVIVDKLELLLFEDLALENLPVGMTGLPLFL